MVADGRGEELMPRAADDAPICAARYASLAGRGGADDMFSSDLSTSELHAALGHIAALSNTCRRLLLLSSAGDEYVPDHVDGPALLERLCAAARGEMGDSGEMVVKEEGWCRGVILAGANHAVSGTGQEQLLAEVQRLLAEVAH